MRVAGLDNLYYCDTDSLMVNEAGLENLRPHIDKSELGMLKGECDSEDVTIHGLKDYSIDGSAKIKGIRKDAQEIDAGIFTQEQFRGLEGMIREGDLDRFLIRTVTKKLMRQYLKGQVAETGKGFPLQLLQR